MKIIKILLVSFSSLLFVQTYACGGWYYSHYYNVYSIENMLHGGTLGNTYHNNKTEFKGNAVDENLEEWVVFFGNKYSAEEIRKLIYTSQGYYDKNKARTTLNKLSTSEIEAFNNYMEFAKKCEIISNAASNYDPWRYVDEIDFERIEQLIIEANNSLKNIKNSFYKERYTFQLIKLLYYGQEYDQAINTYKQFYENNKSTSVLKYWALNYKAGAAMQSEDTITANYNFLQVFHNNSGARNTAYSSMVFSDEKQFNKILALCKTNEEKAAFYFMRGVNRKSVVLEDLKQVLNLAPNSEYAEVLMANEIVKMEHIYWEADSDYKDREWVEDVKRIPSKQLMDYIQKFIPLAQKGSNTLKNKDFWNITLAYLHTLNKEYTISTNMLSAMNTKNETYKIQVKALQLLNYTLSRPNLSIDNENELGKMLFAYNSIKPALDEENEWESVAQLRSINDLLINLLYKKYKDKNDIKALLFSGEALESYKQESSAKMKIEYIQNLRKQLTSKSRTKLIDYGVKTFFKGTNTFKTLEEELIEIEATLYMRNPATLDKAIALFNQIKITKTLDYNPFEMKIKDCIWGNLYYTNRGCKHKATNYTKATFAKKLGETKQIAETKNSAMDYYLLGNAYYNMTYYGPAYSTLSYFRSGSTATGFTDCSIALGFYEKAIVLFKGNKEMQAKATFMAAKCEQNMYFNTIYAKDAWARPIKWDENSEQGIISYNKRAATAGYKKYFKSLKQNFSDTKYYQEIIKECSYFNIYLSKN